MQPRDVDTSVRSMLLFAKILSLIIACVVIEGVHRWITNSDAEFVGGTTVRLILALGTVSVLCLPPVIIAKWNRQLRNGGQPSIIETQHVVYGSLVFIPMSLVWLSDPAIRIFFPYVFPQIDGEAIIKLAPIDDRSSVVFIFCMSIAAPAVVSVCLVSLNSAVKNLLFEAYHLLWLMLLMSLHARNLADVPIIVYHHLSTIIVCAFMKPPVLRPVLEFALHPIFHLLSHPHVHTHAGALPEGIDTETEASSGFQHSSCTSSPWLAALATLLAGKRCRCHVQVFDLLLLAIFSVAVSGAFVVLVALSALFGAASWAMLMYPMGSLVIAVVLGAPYVVLNRFGGVRLRKTPLCASRPIPFAGIAMYVFPMLTCAWIPPVMFWHCASLFSPPQPVHELLLVALSSLPPYVFVRARPHAFRPLGWVLFLVVYFWSNLMLTKFFGAPTDFLYSSDAVRLSLVFFIPLYAFLQSLLSRNASHNTAFKPFLEILATNSNAANHFSNTVADSKIATSYWQAQAAVGTATMQSYKS